MGEWQLDVKDHESDGSEDLLLEHLSVGWVSPRQHGIVECPEDLEHFAGHTLFTQTSGSSETSSFRVEKTVHSSRRGRQVHVTFTDGDEVVFSAREFNELVETVIVWPEDFPVRFDRDKLR
jgi:hypothetical protein